jgi:chemotaxis protein CheZ
MREAISHEELARRLADVRAAWPQTDVNAIAEIVRGVLASMKGDLSAGEASLLSEVEELGRTIASAKAEIAELRVEDINGQHIPSATDELDAIVAHTAAATNQILEACETLDQVADGPMAKEAGASAALQTATTQIYEACSFQDITGQRITKVVATLKSIEGKVAQMLSTFGARRGPLDVSPPQAPTGPLTDADLVNGPQLPAMAMDQSDIDKLLASFD